MDVQILGFFLSHEPVQGQLTDLLELVDMHLTGALVFECAHNTRLLNHILSIGFTPFGENNMMLIL